MATATKLGELTGHYVLDPAGTRIGFVGRHTMASRVRGQFKEFEGSVYLDGVEPSRSRVQLTIQAASLQTHNPQRDDQLRRHFLGIDQHLVITFTSTRIEQTGQTCFKVTGDLAMRGVRKSITVDFELITADNLRLLFTGGGAINRMNWGVDWNAATGVLVSKKVLLELEAAAIWQP